MIREASEFNYRVADESDMARFVNLDKDTVNQLLSDAPVVYGQGKLFAIVEGIAYPASELSDKISLHK